MTKVFIDGSAGTTGLRIHERLADRKELEILSLPPELRKDKTAREEILNAADVAFLCLPDAAAIEAADLVHGNTAVIDTSTAHRTEPGWVYGFPELHGLREKIAAPRSSTPPPPTGPNPAGSTASRSSTACAKRSPPATGSEIRAAMPAVSSPWWSPWCMRAWCRRTRLSPASR